MHQPEYREPESGVAALPWVRLHAAAAYRDMARALEEVPAVRVTVNFVPSLTAQLEALEKGVTDAYEVIARKRAADLDAAERDFMVARFFSVHWGRQIETRTRYRELAEKRRRTAHSPTSAAGFSARDLTDLVVLFHLCWLGFAARADEPAIKDLERKGAGFGEDEKLALLDLVRAQAGKVLPAWRALAERGQVELCCSPFYHPIVPLLIDTDVALRAMPEARLPFRFAFPEDARAQIERALSAHERAFGRRPSGMWPPEGSVSPEAVALYEQCGLRWLCTDEGVLWASFAGQAREALFTSHRLGGVELLFRDRELSDRIGFGYANAPAAASVKDFLARAQRTPPGGLCAVFLDGENAWEAFEDRGAPFLRALYAALAAQPGLRTRTITEALAERAPGRPLARLHSGSWIDSKFAIWIGDPDKNRAWEALAQARRACVDSPPALEHLLIAEGSDWFWWFGEPFHSAEDPIFDRLFRMRLQAAYRAAGLEPPTTLELPIGGTAPKPAQPPRRFVTPRLDGLVTSFYEWDGAGFWDIPRGSAMGESRPLLARIFYGFDRTHFYVRLDPPDADRKTTDPLCALHGTEVRLLLRAGERHLGVRVSVDAVALPLVEEYAPEPRELGHGTGFARVEILELGVALSTLGLSPRQPVELIVQVMSDGVALARYPRDGHLAFVVPDAQFEAENWSA